MYGTFKVNRLLSSTTQFVPKHLPTSNTDVKILESFINDSKRLMILTGAGISTESGIPDYRSEDVGLYATTNHKPVQYHEFMNSANVRQRYWARSYIAWNKFSQCQPNVTHKCVRDLEVVHNKVSVVVTQNVDSLHSKAGSINVIELHGSLNRVVCLCCYSIYSRAEIQNYMFELNPTMNASTNMIRPDGDVDIPQEKIIEFKPPSCYKCKGILKPDVIFFGDNLPRTRSQLVEEFVYKSDSILVLGSTLSVFSAYRIILQGIKENKNIAIVNIGPTRADKDIKLKISANCSDILQKVCYF